ncbi:esterase/lipase family protein [Chloroflexota bacterium]
MRRLSLIIAIGLCIQLIFPSPVQAAQEDAFQVKELNIVFLHGMGGNACAFQLLADYVTEQIPTYISDYEQVNPGTKIRVNMLTRCYPSNVNIDTWANNIADSIDKHFQNKENLILIGHSMGGKVALYAVAKNIGNLADKVATVVTINSPIKKLDDYYVTGGGSAANYCRARWLFSDQGGCNSIAYYDSTQDGDWVGSNKHWLALISSEATPISEQFDFGGIDAWPRNIDDGVIPLSAQYSDGADVVYYGEYGHSDFTALGNVAGFITEQILRYLFGNYIECSVFARSGTFEHEANWLPGTDYWEDMVGEILISSGRRWHINESYTKWQEWEDVVGEYSSGNKRSSYQTNLDGSFLFFTTIEESHWLDPDNPEDCRFYLRTLAGPRNRVQVDWSIYQQGLLPTGIGRDHYEVEIVTGTPLTNITSVLWQTDDSRDLRLQIQSQAESPFRWFQVEWRVYSKENRQVRVVDEIPEQVFLETALGN